MHSCTCSRTCVRMSVYAHACMHACMHAGICMDTHAHTCMCVVVCKHTSSLPQSNAYLCIYVHVCAHACSYACAYICTPVCMRPQVCMCSHMYACMHAPRLISPQRLACILAVLLVGSKRTGTGTARMRPQTQLRYRETYTQTHIQKQPTSKSAQKTDIKEDGKRCKPWNPTGTDTLQCLWKLRRRRTFSTGAELSVYHHRAEPTLRHARQRLTTSCVPPASWRACLATSARCAALPPKR